MRLTQLYEADETAWLERMSKLIRERRYDKLDYKNLSEYLEDMAKRDRREVVSRLTTLLAHLLKWKYQPRRRSRSWRTTILTQRHELQDMLDSETLKNHALEILPKAYERAVHLAISETRLAKKVFPPTCPLTLEELLAEGPLQDGGNGEE